MNQILSNEYIDNFCKVCGLNTRQEVIARDLFGEIIHDEIKLKNDSEKIDYLIDNMAFRIGSTVTDMRSNTRKHEHVIARQLMIYCISKNFTITLSEIGKFFNRDHSTVMYSIEKIQDIFSIQNTYHDSCQEYQYVKFHKEEIEKFIISNFR